MEISFKDKVAFIAGASVGIGAAIAKTLSASGASIGIMARRPDILQKLEAEIIQTGGKVIAVAGDVSKPEDVEKAVEMTVRRFGGLHHAVNNAGISGEFGLLHETSIKNWKNVMGVNLDGIFYGMKYEIAAMLKGDGGSIVNIGSVEGSTILPQNAAYTSTKYAIKGITRTAAFDYGHLGIRINTVSPGVIDTPLTQSHGDISGPMGKVIPLGRMGKSQEIADVVTFVLSDKASYMTGAEILVDGAFLLRQPVA